MKTSGMIPEPAHLRRKNSPMIEESAVVYFGSTNTTLMRFLSFFPVF